MDYEGYSNFTADWEGEDDYRYDDNPWVKTFFNVVQGSAAVLGLLANVLLLVVFAAAPRLCNTPNMFLVQRAIADMVALIAVPLFIAERTLSEKVSGMCTALAILMHVGVVASNMLLMAFTVDGYQAAYPQHQTLPFRRKMMWLMSAAAWLVAGYAGVAAYCSTYMQDEVCIMGPFITTWFEIEHIVKPLILQLVVPLAVVWSFVSVALSPRPDWLPAAQEKKAVPGREEGPSRHLLLGLASCFTVTNGLYWLVAIFLPPHRLFHFIQATAFSLPNFGQAFNAILVIGLSEELRQKVAEWLPSRSCHFASLPLQEL